MISPYHPGFNLFVLMWCWVEFQRCSFATILQNLFGCKVSQVIPNTLNVTYIITISLSLYYLVVAFILNLLYYLYISYPCCDITLANLEPLPYKQLKYHYLLSVICNLLENTNIFIRNIILLINN